MSGNDYSYKTIEMKQKIGENIDVTNIVTKMFVAPQHASHKWLS